MERQVVDQYLAKTRQRGFVLGLGNMKKVLDALERPDLNYKIIHVAGTNGKGSTCTMTQNILTENGYKTGLYTSPELLRVNERMKIDGEEISDEDYVEIFIRIMNLCEEKQIPITEFEILTAVALEYFSVKKCDFVVVEVGMGGRLDATNIIEKPLLSVITSIDYDHTDYLGESLEEIATEKAGIIKRAPLLLYPQREVVEETIFSIAEEKKVPVFQPDFKKVNRIATTPEIQVFEYKGYEVTINLLGDYQVYNGAMVVEIVEYLMDQGYSLDKEKILQGFANTSMIARLQKIYEKPLIYIDGAHNVSGVMELKKALEKIYPNKKFTFIVGFLKDKDYEEEIKILNEIANCFITVEPDYPERKLDSGILADKISKYQENVKDLKEIEEALSFVIDQYTDEIIVICGSFYMVKDALRKLEEINGKVF